MDVNREQEEIKKMKIGIVCFPTVGGSGIVATELGMAFADKGNQVHFISYKQPYRLDTFRNNILFHEVIIPDYPLFETPQYVLALASKLVEVVKYEKLDLIHVHYAIPNASAAFMAKQILRSEGIEIPIITTLHGTDITLVGKDPSYEPVVTFSINQSDFVTCVSESLKEDTLRYFDVKKEITVIPNFLNLDRFKRNFDEEIRAKYAATDEKIIIHASNFRKVKRVGDVIKIFKGIQSKVPSKLILIGDGPERYKLEQLCREENLCDYIHFTGKVSSIEKLLSIGDLFLLPSQTESFGLAALEAMACAVPIISSDSGGLPDVNKNGYSGYTCPVGDVEGMIEKSLDVLNNQDQFNEQALAQALKFDLKNILPLYEKLYAELLTLDLT